jgi:ABC-type Fe3+/spermidine/putrescine transport system ATPase subunit
VDIYRRPAGPFVAEFVGSANRLHGSVTTSASAGELVDVQTGVGVLSVVAREAFAVADEVQVVIRPENLHLTTEAESETFNYLDCTIETITFAGSHTNLVVSCNDIELQAEIHQYDELSAGDSVRFRLGPRWCTAVRLAGPSGDLVTEPVEQEELELSGTEEAHHG